MRVGILTPYQRREVTYLSLGLAQFVAGVGGIPGIRTETTPCGAVDPYWDRRRSLATRVPFRPWAATQDVLVWTTPPDPEEFEWALYQRKRTILLLAWDAFQADAHPLLSLFDRIVVPSAGGARYIRSLTGLSQIVGIPWDSLLPQTRKEGPTTRGLRVFLPLYSCQPERLQMAVLDVAQALLRDEPGVSMTIVYDRLSGSARKRVAELRDRCVVQREPRWDRQLVACAAHDVSLWLSLTENAGLVGLQSLAMGTPVITFDHVVQREVVGSYSGALLPARAEVQPNGTPLLVPDYAQTLERLRQLVQQPAWLKTVRQQTLGDRGVRERVFADRWRDVLKLRRGAV